MKNIRFWASDDESGIGPWASLSKDVVFRVVSMLPAADYASLQCVSKSWRAIVSSVPSSHHRDQLPLLLIPPSYALPDPLLLCRRRTLVANNPLGPVVRFPRLGDRRILAPPIFHLDVPRDRHLLPSLSNTARHVCVGSSHGWLVLLGPDSRVSLLNPLTAAAIPLPPPLSSVSYLFPVRAHDIDEYLLPHGLHRPLHLAALIRVAVLSADPSADPSDGPSSFVLVVVLGNDATSRVVTCGPGNGYTTWRHHWVHHDVDIPATSLTDLAFHDGLCFAAVRGRYVAVFDFGASPAFRRLLHIGDDDDYNDPASYAGFLVESEGELLLVRRLGQTTGARISIYKLPPIEGDGVIVPVPKDGLRSRALFLGTGNSVSVAARDFSQFVRGNKVYFTDVCCEPGDDRAVFVGRVYESDVAQGSTRKAFGVVEERDVNMWLHLRPFWVTPNLHRRDPQAPRGDSTDGGRN